jgi:TP901 family phage tail tape measure protein
MFEGTDNVSKTIDGLSGKLDGFAGTVGNVTQPLSDMADAVLKVELALAALAVGGLVLAFNESKKFESSMIELKKVVGDNAEGLEAAKLNAISLSETYGESSGDIVAATANWVQAGFDLEDSMKLTKAAMDLVIAGSLDSSQATEILIATLKGFKAPAEEVGRIVDILNEVSNRYATNVEELGIGMAELSPIASLMGFSFEETAGLLTPVIEVFRSGSEAGTALKVALLKLVDDRKPVTDALTAIGVSQKDANGELKSGRDILYEVAAAFEKLTPEQQIFFAQNLVGIEQAGRMVEVFTQLAYVQEVTAVAMGAAGSAAAEVAVRLASAEVAVDRFIAAAQNLAVAVGDQFRLAAVEALNGATEIEITLKNMVNAGTFAPILDLVAEFANNLGADLKEIAKVLPEAFAGVDWTRLTDSLRGVGSSIVGLFEAAFGDVDLTTAEGLREVIQKIVDGVAALTRVTEGILVAWKPFIEAIAAAVEKFVNADAETQKLSGNILGIGQAINSIMDRFGVLTGALDGISLALKVLAGTHLFNAIGALGGFASGTGGAVAALGPFQAIAAAIAAGWVIDKILDATVPKWKENKDAIADNVSVMHGASDANDEWIGSAEAAETVAEAQKDIWQQLTEAIDAMPEKVSTEVEAVGTALTKREIEEIQKAFAGIEETKTVQVTAEADGTEIARVKDIIVKEFPDGRIVLIQTKNDQPSIDKSKTDLDNDLPKDREIEIKLKGEIETEIARINAQAETLQTAFEWKAKVDIAETEAVFETLRNQATVIADMFENTGDVLIGLAGAFADVGGLARLEIMELMEEESRRRDALLIEQQKLTDAQVKYLDARTKAMQAGDAIITINADGLSAELELVLQRIVELAQIRANEEGLAFLLGVT